MEASVETEVDRSSTGVQLDERGSRHAADRVTAPPTYAAPGVVAMAQTLPSNTGANRLLTAPVLASKATRLWRGYDLVESDTASKNPPAYMVWPDRATASTCGWGTAVDVTRFGVVDAAVSLTTPA